MMKRIFFSGGLAAVLVCSFSAQAQTSPMPPSAMRSLGDASDPPYPAGTGSMNSVLKGIYARLPPQSVTLVACQGGTSAPITTLTTTPVTVCQSATTRTALNLTETTGTYAGAPLGGCTTDGSAPSPTSFDYPLQGAGTGFSLGAPFSLGPVICVAFSGMITIKAAAAQTGNLP